MEERNDNKVDKVSFTIEGTLFKDDKELSGVEITSCEGKYLVDSKVFNDFLEISGKYKILQLTNARLSELWKTYNCAVGKNDESLIKELVALIESISQFDEIASIKEQLEELIKAFSSMNVSVDNTEEVIKLRQQLQAAEAKLNAEPDMKALGRMLNAKSAQVRGEKRIKSQAVILSCAIRGKSPSEISDVLAERGYGNSLAVVSRALSVLQPDDKERLKDIMNSCPDEFSDVTDDDFEKWYSARHEKALKSYKKKLINQRVKAEVEKEFSQGLTEMPAGDDWGK